MADKQIGELEPATGIFDETKIPGDQQGTAVYMTGLQIKEFAASVFPRFKVPDGGEFGQALLRASPTIAIWGDIANSFNGRTGMVEPQSGDYTAEMVGADKAGSAAAAEEAAKQASIPREEKGTAGGVAGLGQDGKVPTEQLPDLHYLPLSGGTMEGAIELPKNPETPMQAATKKYVDEKTASITPGTPGATEEVSQGLGERLDRLGTQLMHGIVSSTLTTNDEKVIRTRDGAEIFAWWNQAAIYQKAAEEAAEEEVKRVSIPRTEKGIAGGVAGLGQDGKVPSEQLPDLNYLPLSGGTMEGAIELPKDPDTPMQAATKKYVDAALDAFRLEINELTNAVTSVIQKMESAITVSRRTTQT